MTTKYAIGSNTSGYMPDSEPYEIHGNAQAIDALKSEMRLTIESFDGFDDTNVDKYSEEWLEWAVQMAKLHLKKHKQVNIWVRDRVHWIMPI